MAGLSLGSSLLPMMSSLLLAGCEAADAEVGAADTCRNWESGMLLVRLDFWRVVWCPNLLKHEWKDGVTSEWYVSVVKYLSADRMWRGNRFGCLL